jgi:hypothetical protein
MTLIHPQTAWSPMVGQPGASELGPPQIRACNPRSRAGQGVAAGGPQAAKRTGHSW